MTRFWPFASRLLVLAAGLLIVFGIVRWINHPSLGAGWQPSGEVYWVRPQSPAAAVLDTSTRLLAIDGAAPRQVLMMLPDREVGDVVSLTIEKDGRRRQVELPVEPATLPEILQGASAMLLAVIFLGFGIYLVLRAETSDQTRAALTAGTFFALIGAVIAMGSLGAYGPTWLFQAYGVSLWIVGTWSTLLHLWFPRPTKLSRHPLVVGTVVLLGAGGVLWSLLAPHDYLGSVNANAYLGANIWLVINLCASLGLLLWGWLRSPTLAERRQLGVITGGGFMAIVPLLGLSLIPLLVFRLQSTDYGLELLPLVLLPASYSYALMRYRRMAQDWNKSATRALGYLFTATCMSLLMALTLAFPNYQGVSRETLILAAILVAGFTAGPFTRLIENSLGALVFGQMSDPLRQTAKATDAIDLSIDTNDLSGQVTVALKTHLDIEHSALLLIGPDSELTDPHNAAVAKIIQGTRLIKGSSADRILDAQNAILELDQIRGDLEGTEAEALLQIPWARIVLPLRAKGALVGLLVAGYRSGTTFLTTEDVAVLQLVARALATAIQRRSLVDRLQVSTSEAIRLAQEVMRVRGEERKRISRDLHDDIIQPMIAMSYGIAMVDAPMAPTLHKNLTDLIGLTRDICFQLREPALDTLGFGAATRSAVADFMKRTGQIVAVAVDEDIRAKVPETVASAALGVLNEALANAYKHAQADLVEVKVVIHTESLGVTVSDNGKGFDMDEAKPRAMATRHFGLLSMNERAAGAGGTITISARPGQGAKVEATFPFPKM